MDLLNLGDPTFNKGLRVYYAWIPVVFFAVFALGLLIAAAWLTGGLLVLFTVLIVPPVWKKLPFPYAVKILCGAALLIGAYFSIHLYI